MHFTKRGLLEKKVVSINYIWQLPEVQKIPRKQQPDGSWKIHRKKTVSYPECAESLLGSNHKPRKEEIGYEN